MKGETPSPGALESAADYAWNFKTSYLTLPEIFYRRVAPVGVAAPQMVILNTGLARDMGLDPDALDAQTAAPLFVGNRLPRGATPLAQAYAGHQFGGFTHLGDGRAVLLGEHITPQEQRLDVQFKGSGPTPFSRRGDGRAALGPMLREYIISEAMHGLGIPTTRSLAVALTGETVYRETAQTGAVLTRVASSHLRVGTFQYAAVHDQVPALALYAMDRHDPQARDADCPALAFFRGVAERQLWLIVEWMRVGFIHGVMNTDNMTVSGETIDYGPCAFMEAYDPATVFSSIDRGGRYAFGRQPMMAQWNLVRFAESLLPLLANDEAHAIAVAEQEIASFKGCFADLWRHMMGKKLGLSERVQSDDALFQDLLTWMQGAQADYTRTFRMLTDSLQQGVFPRDVQTWPEDPDMGQRAFTSWFARWLARVDEQPEGRVTAVALMETVNPVYIPRNHQVEDVLQAAENGDLAPLHRLLAVLAAPYARRAGLDAFEQPAARGGPRYQTFCGT